MTLRPEGSGLRILLLTHYYAPEVGAPQTRLRETARELVALGAEVQVVTGPPHYPDGAVRSGYRMLSLERGTIDGLRVTRLPMIARPNSGLIDRTIDHASFAFSAIAAWPLVRWADVLLVESPPLFLGLTAAIHRIVARRPYVFHVADPWPDYPIAMGALRHPAAQRLAYANEAIAYALAAGITTVTAPLVDRLARKPGAGGKVHLVPNGVDLARFPLDRSSSAARSRLGWPDATLSLVYVGTVGMAQGVGTLVDAMTELRDAGVVLHIVGGGVDRPEIEARLRREGISNVHLRDAVPASEVPDWLAAADASVVLLRRGVLYEESLPTKLVEGLAAGRPVIVSADGEAARIVRDAGAGRVAPAEDGPALAAAIRSLAEASDRAEIGRRARSAAEAQFDRRATVARLARVLAAAAAGRDRRR